MGGFYLFIKFFNMTFLFTVLMIILQITSSRAESNSNETWGDFPEDESSLPSLDYSDDGLGGYYKFARSLVYNSLVTSPLDLFGKVNGAKIDIDILKEVIIENIGFIVAIVIGILFIIIFSLVGLCFCCCRNCNNCGGKPIQKKRSDKKRKIYVFFLLISVIFCTTGLACMFASLAQIERNVKTVPKTIKTSVNYLNVYIDKLFEQVNFIGTKTETLLMDAIEDEMNNIGRNVGGKLQTDINDATQIETLFKTIRRFESNMKPIQNILHDVNSSVEALKPAVNKLNASLSTLKKDIAASGCTTCGNTNALETHFDTDNLPDITSNINNIDDILAKGLGSILDPSEKSYRDIPELVQNNSQTISKDMKDVIKTFRSTIENYKKDTKNLKTKLGNQMNLTTNLKNIGIEMDFEDVNDEFNKYWLAIWIPFGCIAVLIPLFQILGIILGTFGNGASVKPTERNSLSNCGGICLMFSVGFMFFFGWLFMTLTTLTYIPGSVFERYGCDMIRNFDSNLDKIMDTAMPNQKVLGNVIPIEINVSLSDLYSRCKAGESIPEAVELDNIINTTINDFKKQIKIKDKIETISVDLSHIEIMNSDVESWFKDMKAGLDIDFVNFTSELQKEPTQANLTQISTALSRVSSPLAKTAKDIENNEVKNVKDLKDSLLKNMTLLENKIQESLKMYEKLVSSINTSQDFLSNRIQGTIKNQLLKFADHLLRFWNNFVSNILRLLNSMLSCKPAVDLFEFLAIGLVCGTVDAVNGFWFGLGWFIFFCIPGIILSVKLAKYYRRMRFSDEMDSSNMQMSSDVSYNSAHHQFPNNKVGQM